MKEPWSKRHKRDFGSCRFSLSNSFAEPLSQSELVDLTEARGDAELLEDYLRHELTYTPNGGSDDLRQAIADLYNSERNETTTTTPLLTKENVLVFPGGQVALQTAAQALARNRHSIVFRPGYQSTVESPEWAPGCLGVTKLERSASDGWRIDVAAFREAVRPDTGYVLINEPHNPSGVVMTRATQTALVEACRRSRGGDGDDGDGDDRRPVVVLCDEVYRLLEHDPSDRIPAMALAYPEGGISCVSMSKPWGACGLTVGWLVASNADLLRTVKDCQYFGTACVGRACEIQALMVLRASESILADRRSVVLANKELLRKTIEEDHPDLLGWVRPNAGAIAFVKFKGPLTSRELGDLLASRGISIKPAYCFTGHDDDDDDCDDDVKQRFRVGFGERRMPPALRAFVEVIEEHKDAWREEMKRREAADTAAANEEANRS